MKTLSTLIALSILTLGVVPVHAQGLSLGPQLGYYRASDADDGQFMYGAALRARLLPVLGVEGSVNYRQESYGNDLVTVRSWPVMVTGLLYPFPMIYGAVGAGWYNTTLDFDGAYADQTSQEFGWHFGGGVEIPLGPAASLTGDVRYVFLNYDFGDVPGVADNDSDFVVFTVGLLFGG